MGFWRALASFAPPTLLAASLGAAAAGAVVLAGAPADAATSYDSTYGFERTWNAAVRLVRVDRGFKIDEKDDQTGYLMFEYRSPEGNAKSVTPGTMEFVRSKEPDAPVRVVVQLAQMPRYHEQSLLDALVRKMRNEYGDPPTARPKPPPGPPPDGGPDGGEAAEP